MERPEMSATRQRWQACATARSLIAVLLGLALLAIACENTTPSEEQRVELEEILLEYLNDLAEAYSTGELSPLQRHASRNEISEVKRLLDKLQMTGDRLQAMLLHAEIDEAMIFRRINATVTLTEVWDVARYDSYTGHEKGRNPQSIQSSVIQLRIVDGQWKVIGRRVLETQSDSAWSVTPEPEAGSE